MLVLLLGPMAPPPQEDQSSTSIVTTPTGTDGPLGWCFGASRPAPASQRDPVRKPRSEATPRNHSTCGRRFRGGGVRFTPGVAADGAVVETVTVTGTGAVPPGVIVLGETEQVDCAGVPLQLKDTAWLNPPAGLRFSV